MDMAHWSNEVRSIFGVDPKEFHPTWENFLNLVHSSDREQLSNKVRDSRESGKPLDVEYRINRPDGIERVVHSLSEVRYDEEGKAVGLIGSLQDITERKEMEAALVKSELLFRNLAEQSPNMIYISRRERIVYVNNCFEAVMGYKRKEFYSPNFDALTMIAPEYRDLAKDSSGRHLQGEEVPPHEYTLLTKDGKRLDVIQATKLIEYEGESAVLGILTDITERKQAEDALKESEERFHLFATATFEAIAIHYGGILIEANDQYYRMFGYEPDELIGKDAFPLTVAPQARESMREQVVTGTRGSYESIGMKKDRTEFPVEIQGKEMEYGGRQVRVGAIRDITERRRAEEALRKSEERYRNIVENLPLGVHTYQLEDDGMLRFTGSNPAADKILGVDNRQYIGKTIEEGFPEIVKTEIPERFREIAEKNGFWHNEDIVYKDDRIEGVFENFNFQTSPGNMVSMFRDITERKQAEEALRDSEEKLRSIVENSSDQIFMLDKDYKFLSINKTAADIFRKSPQEMIGTSIFAVFPEDTAVRFSKNIKNVFDTGKGMLIEEKMITQGGEFYNSTSLNPVKDDKGNVIAVTGIVRDITERRQLEEERRRIERLESLGTLAGGIAHDFNNLLTGIMGNIGLARDNVEPESKADERLLEAERASLRARDLTQQLLTFARGGEPIRETASIRELIGDSATFALGGSKSTCVIDVPENLWQADVDKGQINEVIHNLVINANEAMPGGGVINISARNRVFGEENPLHLPKGDYIEVSIEDRGVGILEDNLTRIFDPYFTTKEKGSGLGLATTHSIIKNHQGHINVNSVAGVGTTFHIYLPATRKPSLLPEEEAEDIQASVTGKILIMDDDEAIRRLMQRALSEVGHDIAVAINGTDAIEQYVRAREEGQPFDLVMLDLTVPGGMGGMETMEKLLEIDPDIKSIVSSGYSTDPIMADYEKYGFSAVIAKPYRVRELRRMIRDIL